MFRIATCIAVLATPLAAQPSETLCNVSGEIVQAAVDARLDGVADNRAMRQIGRTMTDAKEPYKPAVAPIVSWVYTLPEEQLTEDAAASFLQACLAQ